MINLNLSTAVFPLGNAHWDGTAIVGNTSSDDPEFVIPRVALQPTRFYRVEVDFGAYDPADDPYVFIAPTDATESGTSFDELSEVFLFTSGDGTPVTAIAYMGPGMGDWDSNVPSGFNHLWFYVDRRIPITAIRIQMGTVDTDWSDWHDDAELVWWSRNIISPEPSNDIHQQRSYDVIESGSYPPGDINEAWSGTGHYLAGTPELTNGSGTNASMFLGDNLGNLYIWEQRWWTKTRTADEVTVTAGILPDIWASDPPVLTEWEPTNVPIEHRLEIHAASTVSDNYIVKGFVVSGPDGWNPGVFLDRGTMVAQPDLVTQFLPGDESFADTQVFYADDAALAAIGYPFTGEAYYVIGIVDMPTQTGTWDGVTRQARVTSISPMTAYQPRYRVKAFIAVNSEITGVEDLNRASFL